MTVEAPDIDSLADRVRELWIKEHRDFVERKTHMRSSWNSDVKWDGGYRGAGGRRAGPIWPTLAKFIVSSGADAGLFIRAMFALQPGNYPPTPKMATTPGVALARYRDFMNQQQIDPLLELKIQMSELERALFALRPTHPESNDALGAALCDRTLGLSALFRYCVASQGGLEDVASLWRPTARLQYLSHRPAYDKVWADCIPSNILENDANG